MPSHQHTARHPSKGWDLRPLHDKVEQIPPLRIALLDQPNLPIPLPGFQRLFPGDGILDPVMLLSQHQPIQIIFAAESRTHAATVLVDAGGKAAGAPHIQNDMRLVGHDVGPTSPHGHVSPPALPAFAATTTGFTPGPASPPRIPPA